MNIFPHPLDAKREDGMKKKPKKVWVVYDEPELVVFYSKQEAMDYYDLYKKECCGKIKKPARYVRCKK